MIQISWNSHELEEFAKSQIRNLQLFMFTIPNGYLTCQLTAAGAADAPIGIHPQSPEFSLLVACIRDCDKA